MSQTLRQQSADGVLVSSSRGITLQVGTAVPTNGTSGYAPGGIFMDQDAAAGSQFYINEGTGTSSTFRALASVTSAAGVVGVAAGYKIARGETALDGSNPTPVATGLTTVVSFTATLKGTAAPGDSTSVLTADISGPTVNVYAWKHTTGGAAGNPTLIASTGTETFYWTAVGT